MPFAAIPRVEHVGETIIDDGGYAAEARQAQHPAKPDVAWRTQPDLDSAIGADMEPATRIDAMQTAADILDAGAEAGERLRLIVDAATHQNLKPA